MMLLNAIKPDIDSLSSINDIDIDNYSNSTQQVSSNSITINGNSLNGYSITTNPYINNQSIAIGSIDSYCDYKTVINGFMNKEETGVQLNILEKYFKMGLINSNSYDRKLNKNEFFDLLTLYIKKLTNRDCKVDFKKDMMLESITFSFDFSTSFTLNNDDDLQPETYLFFKDTFYINTENLLAILKKATFNRLLNVTVTN